MFYFTSSGQRINQMIKEIIQEIEAVKNGIEKFMILFWVQILFVNIMVIIKELVV